MYIRQFNKCLGIVFSSCKLLLRTHPQVFYVCLTCAGLKIRRVETKIKTSYGGGECCIFTA